MVQNYPAIKNNPLLPPLLHGYGAPDLYGQTVPRKKHKRNNNHNLGNGNGNGFNNKQQHLSKSYSYSDYFAYGNPALNPVKKSTVSALVKSKKPALKFFPSPTPRTKGYSNSKSAVTVRPYGQPYVDPMHHNKAMMASPTERSAVVYKGSRNKNSYPRSALASAVGRRPPRKRKANGGGDFDSPEEFSPDGFFTEADFPKFPGFAKSTSHFSMMSPLRPFPSLKHGAGGRRSRTGDNHRGFNSKAASVWGRRRSSG